ncbi:putative transposase YbfD/YdcC [Streptomyces sp. B4I13]|uniref:ISAs1 family transposase n=1 Tax=Streptomyces sp. B4I13 TaxID=3042271 RepID=UPI0027841F94|nr:ISAs1 family transposase [Streptomyces sp. B4I13]MDQ0963419.1 putative transposase YbfD/YdcC [Streptomyces sp. B4I13]
MTGTGMTVTQLRGAEKTNEITCVAALLNRYDLQGVTVTGDALHTQRDHARFLVEEKKAHCAFTVKRNQKNLDEQLRTLPWQKAAAKDYDRTEGHGREETRVVRVLTVTDLGVGFPHAPGRQGRTPPTDSKSGKQSRETVYVITDLTSRQASPERIAKILRAHWVIENRLHFVRDTAFREDASKIRTGHGPENMATLRSFAINQLRHRRPDQHRRRTPHHSPPPLRTATDRPRTQLTCAKGTIDGLCNRPGGKPQRP